MSVSNSKVSKYSNKNKNLLSESGNIRRRIANNKNEIVTNDSDHVCCVLYFVVNKNNEVISIQICDFIQSVFLPNNI